MTAFASDGVWTRHVAAEPVQSALRRAEVLSGVHGVAEVGSTQDLALELASASASAGTVIVADRQVSGRGRAGRTWEDRPDGGTLALTVLLDVGEQFPRARALELGLVPHALGVAVLGAAEQVAPQVEGFALKWPNDLVHRSDEAAPARKVAGVLVEREHVEVPEGARDVLLCGIGVDVDLVAGGGGPDRVCLTELCGRPPDRAELLAALLVALDEALVLLRSTPHELLARYRRRSDTLGRLVRVDMPGAPVVVGTVTGIDDGGQLLVTTQGVERAILSGTVRDAGPDDRPLATSEGIR